MAAKTLDEIRMDLLDELAEAFKNAAQGQARGGLNGDAGLWMAYHHTRAVAHDFGIHLTSCTEGRRVGDARRRWDDEDKPSDT